MKKKTCVTDRFGAWFGMWLLTVNKFSWIFTYMWIRKLNMFKLMFEFNN